MKRLAALFALWLLAWPALAADNILIEQPNGTNAIVRSTESGGVQTIVVSCPACTTASAIAVGTTNVTGGVSGRLLYDNGTLGEYPIGTGVATALSNTAGGVGGFALQNTFLPAGVFNSAVLTAGTGYVPGDSITTTISGATTSTLYGQYTNLILMVTDTQVVSATVAAGGSGGSNGTQTVTGTTGTGTKFQASVTVAGGTITAVISISVGGDYTANPTSIAAEPVTGASLTGAQLNVVMGVQQAFVQNPGNYTVIPGSTATATQSSTSGTGTGASFTASFGAMAAFLLPPNQTGNAAGTSLYIGQKSGISVTTGNENTFIGWNTGSVCTTCTFDTAIGTNAMGTGMVSGSSSVAVGTDAMRNAGSLNNVVVVGNNTVRNPSATVTRVAGIGHNGAQGQSSSTGVDIAFVGNLAFGSANWTTGSRDIAIGSNTLAAVTSANDVVAIGHNAGTLATSGSSSVFIGSFAGAAVTITSGNSLGGFNAFKATNTNDNTSWGYLSGQNFSGGSGQNAFFGSQVASGAGGNGSTNACFGFKACLALTNGGTNLVVGPNVGSVSLTTASNVVLIGTTSSIDTNTSNVIQVGAGSTAVWSATGTGTPSTSVSTIAGLLTIGSTSDAASSTGGALVVPGGASVAKRFWIPAISASAGLQTAVLCQSSGGEMIADSVACLASGAQFKNILGPMQDGALDKLIRLPVDRWAYKAEGNFRSDDWTRERIGPIAQDVAAMDSRLVGYDNDGNVRTYSTEQLLAYTIKAVQELNAKVEARR